MTTLRIAETDGAVADGLYHMTISLEMDGVQSHGAATTFAFQWTSQDREDIRWYLEDYPEYQSDPAPVIAARIKLRMEQLGSNLFAALFYQNEETRRIWHDVCDRLVNMRVEIIAGAGRASLLPWELLREPDRGNWLMLETRAFIRSAQQRGGIGAVTISLEGPLRVLLVICRPHGANDVPFRSVGGRLDKVLSVSARERLELNVLRPPTFDRLREVLMESMEEGRPYHIVHFDGHGVYESYEPGHGRCSLLFETATPWFKTGSSHDEGATASGSGVSCMPLVTGTQIGSVLVRAGVPVLIVNACRSAHAEVPPEPEPVGTGAPAQQMAGGFLKERIFGSLAEDVMAAGVTGVVAMRYNVYVGTAAQFVGDLYAALADGGSLAESVTIGRRNLAERSGNTIARNLIDVYDWQVPALFEAGPLTFASRSKEPG